MSILSRNFVQQRIWKRFVSIHDVQRPIVLGIETSCDDTSVAIVSSDRKILTSRRFVNREIQQKFRGINPTVTADTHRNYIDDVIGGCLDDLSCRISDLDAVAVSTRPGLVISLKVGVERAISLCRLGRIPLIPVHHMRAHALCGRLVDENVNFPFLTLLISGGHSILAVAHGPTDFDIVGSGESTSPGECIDKIAREIGIKDEKMHFGAEVERLASLGTVEDCLRYTVKPPKSHGADFNFGSIKTSFLNLVRNDLSLPLDERDLIAFCASLQFQVAGHLCKKLHVGLDFEFLKMLFENLPKSLVVSGGVAANKFILKMIKKIAENDGFRVMVPPKDLCTDNGEMIAWTGIEMLKKNSEIIPFGEIPSFYYVHDKADIGSSDLRSKMIAQKYRPKRRLKVSSLLSDKLIFLGKPIS